MSISMKNLQLKFSSSILFLLALFSIALCLGCSGGGDDGDSSESGKIRYLNANFRLPESFVFRGTDFSEPDEERTLIYGESTDYQSISEGTLSFFVFEDESPVLGEPFEARIRAGSFTTIILTSDGDSDSIVFITDTNADPGGGLFRLRVGNFFDGLEDVDVYLLNAGFSVDEAEPTFSKVDFQDFSRQVTAAIVPSRIVITEADSKSIILDSGSVLFEERKNYTFYILSDLGGGSPPFGVLLEDGD